jgi:hypothetical protein
MYALAKTLCVSRRSLKAKADAAPAQSPGSSTCPEEKSLISELETYLLPIYLKDYFRMGTSPVSAPNKIHIFTGANLHHLAKEICVGR